MGNQSSEIEDGHFEQVALLPDQLATFIHGLQEPTRAPAIFSAEENSIMSDIRKALFYVLDRDEPSGHTDAIPEGFDEAFSKADSLSRSGHPVHVLYTDGASQMQLTRFAEAGIRTSLAPEG